MPSAPISPARLKIAWAVAVAVDLLQVGLMPVTGSLITWVDAPLDIVTMIVLWRLLGWHWALLPSLLVELLPYAELVPTWSGAVFLIQQSRKGEMSAPPEPGERPIKDVTPKPPQPPTLPPS
ncbi:MAG: hypothetical protein LWX11_02310 [Firmicutes bacterium]|nr:hypothetical protein [Bacillota bacterium]